MGSTGASRVDTEENFAVKVPVAEQELDLQTSLRAEQAANIMHQKRIEELERRLCLHNRTHSAPPSSGEVETQQVTIAQLKEQRSQYREGLRQIASILDKGLDVSLSSDSEVWMIEYGHPYA